MIPPSFACKTQHFLQGVTSNSQRLKKSYQALMNSVFPSLYKISWAFWWCIKRHISKKLNFDLPNPDYCTGNVNVSTTVKSFPASSRVWTTTISNKSFAAIAEGRTTTSMPLTTTQSTGRLPKRRRAHENIKIHRRLSPHSRSGKMMPSRITTPLVRLFAAFTQLHLFFLKEHFL